MFGLSYAKAVVPLVVAGLLYLLSNLGVTSGMSVEDAITAAVMAAGVWLVPNKR